MGGRSLSNTNILIRQSFPWRHCKMYSRTKSIDAPIQSTDRFTLVNIWLLFLFLLFIFLVILSFWALICFYTSRGSCIHIHHSVTVNIRTETQLLSEIRLDLLLSSLREIISPATHWQDCTWHPNSIYHIYMYCARVKCRTLNELSIVPRKIWVEGIVLLCCWETPASLSLFIKLNQAEEKLQIYCICCKVGT